METICTVSQYRCEYNLNRLYKTLINKCNSYKIQHSKYLNYINKRPSLKYDYKS